MKKSDHEKQNEMKDYYNRSTYYDNQKHNYPSENSRFNRIRLRNVFSIYKPVKGEKVLDLGCGWGNITLALLQQGIDTTGVDYSERAIKICKEEAMKQGLDPKNFICADASDTGLQTESYNVVFCSDLVEHLYPQVYNNLLKEVHRLLVKNGKFITYTPNPQHIFELLKNRNIILKKDVSHVDYKRMDYLIESLKKNNFRIIKAFHQESHVLFFSIIEKLFMRFIPILRRRNSILAEKRSHPSFFC